MIVYCRYNTRRKKCFQLITTVESRGDNFVINKKAGHQDSKPFLESLLNKYEILNHSDFPLELVRPYRSEKGTLSFGYLRSDSFDLLLQNATKKSSHIEFLDLLKRYKSLIFSIPQVEIVPCHKFKSIFPDLITSQVSCTRYGCLDLNLDNIFIDNDSYKLIDYEWVFDFPIPTNFIIFRAITAFYGNHPSLRPAALMPLSSALEELGISKKEQETYMQLEEAFQIYVYGGSQGDIHNLELLRHKYQHIENPEPVVPFTQKLLALNTYTVLLEKESVRKNNWILRLEEAIKDKDGWIAKIEKDHAELTKSTVELSRIITSQHQYKSISPNPPLMDSSEIEKLQIFIRDLENEMERKNIRALELEDMIANKSRWIDKLEEDIQELKNSIRELRSHMAMISPKIANSDKAA